MDSPAMMGGLEKALCTHYKASFFLLFMYSKETSLFQEEISQRLKIMHQKLIQFNKNLRSEKQHLPELEAGDVVKISRKIKEGTKERTQVFQGMVIAVKARQSSSPTVTVRKVSSGVGVELVLPLHSAQIEKIEVLKKTKAGRSKLYYVRTKSAKVLGKKLKEVPFAIGKAGQEIKDVVREVTEAAKAEVAVETTAQKEEMKQAE